MLVFGHAGITLGAAALLARALASRRFSKTTGNAAAESSPPSSKVVPTLSHSSTNKASQLTFLGSYIDVRLLLIGSILPDVIDKSIGFLFFRETFGTGRLFCHTLLFLIVATVAGLYLYWRHSKTWLLVFSFGTFTHLILDFMWRTPQTLLWPLYGFTFEKGDITNWLSNILRALFTKPIVYMPELVGVVIITWFAWTLLRRRKSISLTNTGESGDPPSVKGG